MITGVGVTGEPSHPPFRDTFLGSKEDLDWLKIDLNAAKIITVQNYRVFIPKSEEFSNKFEVFFFKCKLQFTPTFWYVVHEYKIVKSVVKEQFKDGVI